MEPWARRIHELLAAAGKSQAELARACGIQGGSISGWFGQGKPTKMLSGDNLVAAASFLGTTAEFIMTGRAATSSSQPARLDVGKLAGLIEAVEAVAEADGLALPPRLRARVVAAFYAHSGEDPPVAEAVRAALSALLMSVETE